QIERLYNQAVELESGERSAFLSRVCAGNPQLREKLERLLKAHEIAGDFLSKPALEAVPLAKSESVSLNVPNRIGNYVLLNRLGQGGMGVVYRAQDVRLRRFVAMKFLPKELAKDTHALERFQREARAVAALDHPNICTIYDFGDHEGQPYIVMQLLEGET